MKGVCLSPWSRADALFQDNGASETWVQAWGSGLLLCHRWDPSPMPSPPRWWVPCLTPKWACPPPSCFCHGVTLSQWRNSNNAIPEPEVAEFDGSPVSPWRKSPSCSPGSYISISISISTLSITVPRGSTFLSPHQYLLFLVFSTNYANEYEVKSLSVHF